MRILVLGGYGTTGRLLAELLLARSDAHIVVAGRRFGEAERAAAELASAYPGRVSARVADAREAVSLDRAFEDVDLVAVAASVLACSDVVIAAALRGGIDYFDLLMPGTLKHEALERLQGRIVAAHRCFITDGGIHPGLSAPLIRALAPAFARLERAEVGALLRVDWAAHPFSAATQEEFVNEMRDYRMEVLREGMWTRVAWRAATRVFDFGMPFGRKRCTVMAMPELRGLPELIPTLRDCAFYISGFNPLVDNVVMPIGSLVVRGSRDALVAPYADLLTWSLSRFSHPPFGTVWQVEAEGELAGSLGQAGRRGRAGLRVSHEDGYWLTAASAAACLGQYLDGSLRTPGVHLQALAVEPARFLRDLLAMGVGLESFGADVDNLLAGVDGGRG